MTEDERELLAEFCLRTKTDPVAFVLGAFPWGEPDTALEKMKLEEWQYKILCDIRDNSVDLWGAITRISVSSGHGIGKSALIGMTVCWAMSTCINTRVVVTAATETQLRTKLWPEIAKWMKLSITAPMFVVGATSIQSVEKDHAMHWRVDLTPWSEHNSQAFAGLHNKGSRILLVFDECSTIPNIIWETAEGAMSDSDTQIIWLVFGNPESIEPGRDRFLKCFTDFSRRWIGYKIDSRTVSLTNKKRIQEQLEDWGEDSNYFKVRVMGEFPTEILSSFIPEARAREAFNRTPLSDPGMPLIMGVDCARFGDDSSVIAFRRGGDAKSIAPMIFRELDTMSFADQVAVAIATYRPDAVFIDEGAMGAGVVDRLSQLGHSVIGVDFGKASDWPGPHNSNAKYFNKRAEMYGSVRHWLAYGAIYSESLIEELSCFTYTLKNEKILLESKVDIKAKMGKSPDEADALALTFAYPVAGKLQYLPLGSKLRGELNEVEYDPIGTEDLQNAW